MGFISAIPLFGFILLGYNGLVMSGFFPAQLNTPMLIISLPSGVEWQPDASTVMLILAILILYIELFKSTRTSDVTVVEHMLSTFVLIAFVVEFFIWAPAANSAFLLLTLMALIDVVAGFTITISAARRDLAMMH